MDEWYRFIDLYSISIDFSQVWNGIMAPFWYCVMFYSQWSPWISWDFYKSTDSIDKIDLNRIISWADAVKILTTNLDFILDIKSWISFSKNAINLFISLHAFDVFSTMNHGWIEAAQKSWVSIRRLFIHMWLWIITQLCKHMEPHALVSPENETVRQVKRNVEKSIGMLTSQ